RRRLPVIAFLAPFLFTHLPFTPGAAGSGLRSKSLQLRYSIERGLVGMLELQALLQPVVAVQAGSGIKRVRGIIKVHLFVFGAKGVQPFLRLFARNVVSGGEFKEDALTFGMSDEICGIVPGIILDIL